jgi:integrase/recombinase XerD
LAKSSKRVYQHSYSLWMSFCAENVLHPLHDLTFEHVGQFLDEANATKATKQRRLSALRRLVETAAIIDYENPKWAAMHNALKRVKVTHDDNSGQERNKRALSAREVYAAFDQWAGEKLVQVRNRALLAVAFYAGLRRSELAALTWDDIDFENGLVTVRHGKGDKARTIPFASNEALHHIETWKTRQTIHDSERLYVFCGIKNKGQGELRADKPMSSNGVYKMMQKSGHIAPHDARRTLITDMLNNGVSVSDAQFVAGHVNPQTTLGYAQVKDAKEVKGRIKVSY